MALYDRIHEGLAAELTRRQRIRRLLGGKRRSLKNSPPINKHLSRHDKDLNPPFATSLFTLPGPGSFGPVSIGGIMRHS